MSQIEFTCPSCGALQNVKFKYTKFMVCEYCRSALFMEDDGVRNAGKMSEIADLPSLLQLGIPFKYATATYIPLGRVQYDFGRGCWDEWWCMDNTGQGTWISVDEGDIALEQRIEITEGLPGFDELKVGDQVVLRSYKKTFNVTVVEKQRCKMVGAEGELPFPIIPGEEYNYIDFSGADKMILTAEYFGDDVDCYQGIWLDPFGIKPEGTS
jgi:Domain of unknown function (DUF4178)